jgi:hypothetical protein
MTFDAYKFHPSSLGLIMTESRTKEPLGETAKAHLVECYVRHVYGRHKDVTNAYIEKGLVAEEDSLDLYTLVKDQLFVKNKDIFENDFLIGTPDIVEPDLVIDIKTSWDIFTFYAQTVKAIDKKYWWQLQAYMDLTGANHAKLVYCLVNTPYKLIEDQKRKLMYTMAVIDGDTDEAYLKACEMVDKNSIYDDIPNEEKYIEISIERDQKAIDSAHERVALCRTILNGWTKQK